MDRRVWNVKHGCGYPMLAKELYAWDGAVVVEYRERSGESLPLYHCPRCGRELRLWRDDAGVAPFVRKEQGV